MRHDPILVADRPIGDSSAAAALLAPGFAGLAHEELKVLHMDGALRPLAVGTETGAGGLSVEVPVRRLIGLALALGSRALILAHNHPGGDPTPSRADRTATRRLIEVAHPLDIRVIDHLVFAAAGWRSFRALGLL